MAVILLDRLGSYAGLPHVCGEPCFCRVPPCMPHPLAAFVADFADQAVILPLIACVAIVLWVSGWRRGALVWCFGTAATLGMMAFLKLAFRACGPELFGSGMESPSGHTAAAGAVYGSIFAFANSRLGGRNTSQLLIVAATVVLIGASRVLLGAHTLPEVCLGAAVGFTAARAMLYFAGEPRTHRSVRLLSLSLPLLVLPLSLHGIHLPAESEIAGLAVHVWPFSLCR